MSLKLYLAGISLGTILCFVSSGLVLFYISPGESLFFGPIALFSSLFLGLAGFFTILGFYARIFASKNEVIFNHISPAFREGLLLSLCFTILLLLQALRILNLWLAFLLIGAIILFESYFLSR